ncbi:MAG: DNA cytosine methyltransferase [Caulobacteraceae bacterium]
MTFYEFFAGGGMARTGLGQGWRCLFANDFDPRKTAVYRDNFGAEDLTEGDVWAVRPDQLPGRADLAWASSPCQDLSLAGRRAGLGGARSSAFWGFWRLIEALADEGRAPRAVVIENVVGLLTSHGGADFTALCEAFARAGYRFGVLEMDAALFTPQSRPRMFLVATRADPSIMVQAGPAAPFHTGRVVEAYARLPDHLKACWQWWRSPPPPTRNADLAALLEPDSAVKWRDVDQTAALVAQLSPRHRARLDAAVARDGRAVAAVYRRIRIEKGVRVQRAELRLDGLAGCLRTAGGGSSRQFLLFAEPGRIRSRVLSSREGARLMGLPDDYRLPRAATTALHVAGDGVAVPVVRWLAETLLEPLLLAPEQTLAAE